MARSIDLDTPLLQLSRFDRFTLRDAVQGVCITGGIGSGKTTGSGAPIAGSYLRLRMGGLVLCAKPEEAPLWREYGKKHGRSESLMVVDGRGPIINFLAYEMSRLGGEGLNSVVELLMRVLEMARAASPNPTRSGDTFWEDTIRQILRASLLVILAATGSIRIADLLRFVREAPTSPEQMHDLAWQRDSFFYATFLAATELLGEEDGDRAVSYWRNDFARLDPKTRGNILISLTTTLDRFNHGWLRDAFCTSTTIVPELCFQGVIFVLDMPALTRNEDGILAQQLFKYLWQRSVLARNALAPDQRERPVFLWADEAQYFLNSYDAEFLSTCRGSRCCTVFLSQSLPTYYARMGGENARDRVHHLLGNFATRIWHNNACAETNEWAAKTIGRTLQARASFQRSEGDSTSSGVNLGDGTNWGTNSGSGINWSFSGNLEGSGGSLGGGGSHQHGSSQGASDNRGRSRSVGTTSGSSHGYSEQMDYLLEPAQFGRMLRTGGPANGHRVTAIWYQAGRQFEVSKGNTLLAEFRQ